MRLGDDPGAFVRGLANLDQIGVPGIVGFRLREDELDESHDDRKMIAERMHRLGVEAGALARSVHGQLWNRLRPNGASLFWRRPRGRNPTKWGAPARITILAKRVIRRVAPAR